MADSTITLRVVGDTAKAGNAPAAAPQAPGNAPATAPQRPSGPADSPAPTQGAPSTAQGTPANGGKSLAGKIGAMAGGLFLQQGVSALANGLTGFRPDMQREANWVGNVGGGLLGGAAAGFAAGGPLGAAIGGAVGGLIGAFTSLAESARNVREAFESVRDAEFNTIMSNSAQIDDEAFRKTLEPMTRGQRLKAINERITTIKYGMGDSSLANLRARMDPMIEEEETDTQKYRELQAQYNLQLGRLAQLQTLRSQTEVMPTIMPLASGEVTDALAKRGGTVGPSVDVGSVNKDILAVLKDTYSLLKSRASLPDMLNTEGVGPLVVLQ